MRAIKDLPTELLLHIYASLDTIQDVIALSSTCHGLHAIYASTRQLPLLVAAAERQHGPLADAVRLVTHTPGRPPFSHGGGGGGSSLAAPSLALLAEVNRVGAVANRWADIYPVKKWHADYLNRRSLTPDERARLRRAIYRLWLFAAAFSSPEALAIAPPSWRQQQPSPTQDRLALLRHWSTDELLEMADARAVLRDALAQNVCPSNAAVARKFMARHEGDADAALGGLVFNLSLGPASFDRPRAGKTWAGGLPTPPSDDDDCRVGAGAFHSSATHRAQRRHETWAASLRRGDHGAGAEGWGDGPAHERAVAALLKLDPGAILWLKERKMRRADVLRWLCELGDGAWFERCRDTCGEALEEVLAERRVDDVEEALEMGAGVVAPVEGYSGEEDDDEE
jgi:hypothetical protein